MPAPPSTDAAFVAAIKSDLEAADAETAKGTAAYLEIGRKLNARKEQGKRDGTIPHGEWVNWLERNFPPRNGRDRVRRLQRYMQAAEAIDTADEATKTNLNSFLPEGLNAVLDEVRRIKQRNRPKLVPIPVSGPLANRMEIIHGNCLDILPTITERHFRMAEPPFNQGIRYDGYDDNMPEDKYRDMLIEVFKGHPCVIIHYPEQTINLLGGGVLGGDCQEVVTWVYNSDTAKQHRLVTWWNCKPDFTKLGQPYKNPTDGRVKKLIEEGREARLYDWWEIDQVKNVGKEFDHPCPIPVELARRIILITTNPGDLIVDPFCGSGTIPGVAAVLGRRAIGIDISENYCRIAESRLGAIMEELTPDDGVVEAMREAAE